MDNIFDFYLTNLWADNPTSLHDFSYGDLINSKLKSLPVIIPPIVRNRLPTGNHDISAWPRCQIANNGRFDVNHGIHSIRLHNVYTFTNLKE